MASSRSWAASCVGPHRAGLGVHRRLRPRLRDVAQHVDDRDLVLGHARRRGAAVVLARLERPGADRATADDRPVELSVGPVGGAGPTLGVRECRLGGDPRARRRLRRAIGQRHREGGRRYRCRRGASGSARNAQSSATTGAPRRATRPIPSRTNTSASGIKSFCSAQFPPGIHRLVKLIVEGCSCLV